MALVVDLKRWLAHRSRKPLVVDTVVMHATAGGSAKSSIGWLVQIGYSYHAIIERDGTTTKCVPLSQCAFHAGKSAGPQGPNVNEYSVGVCFANRNDGVEKITHEQLESAVWYVKRLKAQFPRLRYVCTHFGISPGRKFDPKLFDVEAFAERVGLTAWKRPDAVWRLF